MPGSRFRIAGAGLLAAWAALAPAAAARAQGTVFGGVVAGDVRTAYVGVAAPLPGARVGQGLALRAILSGSQYKYDAAFGRVRGRDLRADVSLLWQVSDAHTYFDFGLGGRYVDTRLKPDDPGNPRRGGHWEGVVSAGGQQTFDPWYASEFGAYGFQGRDYFVRGDVTRRIAGPWRLGVEAQADGARDYARRSVGAVLALSASPAWEVKLSGGVTDQSHRSGGYGGLTFRRSF